MQVIIFAVIIAHYYNNEKLINKKKIFSLKT